MKNKEIKLFLNSIKNINNKYINTIKNKKIGYEMSESHSEKKYYIKLNDRSDKSNKITK